jgi:hypothetical protein
MTKQQETERAALRRKPAREAASPPRPAAAPPQSKPDADDAAPVETAQGRSKGEDFFKLVETIPSVGPSLSYILKHWGVTGLILFAAGALFSSGLVWFGVLPAALVSEKYKQAAAASVPGGVRRASLRSIDFEALPGEGRPDWIQLCSDSLEREANLQKLSSLPDLLYDVEVFRYGVEEPTQKFEFALQAGAGFELTARAFRQSQGLIQPLDFESRQEQAVAGITFKVPECDAGDSLLLIVRSEWAHGTQFRNVRSTFSTSITK